MAWAFVSKAVAQSPDANNATTSGIDTTGADTLFIVACWYASIIEDVTVSDSKSNTWTALTKQSDGSNSRLRIWYAKNATVGTGHTFTVNSSTQYGSISASAFSGGHLTTPFDTGIESGASTAGATSLAPGSVTPSENNCLLLTALGNQDSNGSTATTPSGYTGLNTVDRIAFGLGISTAYLIQTTAGASNPSWSWTTSQRDSAVIASFKSAAGGGGSVFMPPFKPPNLSGLGSGGSFFQDRLG